MKAREAEENKKKRKKVRNSPKEKERADPQKVNQKKKRKQQITNPQQKRTPAEDKTKKEQNRSRMKTWKGEEGEKVEKEGGNENGEASIFVV